MRLGEFYARRLMASGLGFDMLFGPAYKGITLAAAVAIELARRGRAVRSRTTARKQKITERAASSSAHRCGDARSSSMM